MFLSFLLNRQFDPHHLSPGVLCKSLLPTYLVSLPLAPIKSIPPSVPYNDSSNTETWPCPFAPLKPFIASPLLLRQSQFFFSMAARSSQIWPCPPLSFILELTFPPTISGVQQHLTLLIPSFFLPTINSLFLCCPATSSTLSPMALTP